MVYKNIIPNLGEVPKNALIVNPTEKPNLIDRELHDRFIKETWQKIGAVSDVLFTVTTGGVYALGKTTLQVGTKVTVGMVVDVVLQVGLEALAHDDFEIALNNIDYGQVAYSGAESLIPGWRTQATLGCVRVAVIESLQRNDFDLNRISKACLSNLIMNILSNGAIKKDSFLSNKFTMIVEKAPGNVVKNLKKLGADRDLVEWVAAHTGCKLTEYIDKYY